jgi:16S rRNA (cytosine967-C5)-methyltransferase
MQRIQLEAARVVSKIMHDGRNLTQTLNESLRKLPACTAQERGALQDLSYGTLRHFSRLSFVLDSLLERPVKDKLLRHLLLVAIYQLQHTKAGQHVIVGQAVEAARSLNTSVSGLVNAVLRNFLRRQPQLLEAADRHEASRYSYQQWWIDSVRAQYGANAAAILEAGNGHPPMTLRVNVRSTSLTDYQALLAEQGIAARIVESGALMLDRPVAIERLPKFNDGWVSVQDAGAQLAAILLDVKDGMRVLDACAAPGGKTTHLSWQMLCWWLCTRKKNDCSECAKIYSVCA